MSEDLVNELPEARCNFNEDNDQMLSAIEIGYWSLVRRVTCSKGQMSEGSKVRRVTCPKGQKSKNN